jgi:ADP-heptose:LPS heptosyltransferase
VSSEVVKDNPCLDEVVVYRKPIGKVISYLRKADFDLVVELSNRGSWITPLIGSPYNVGFRKRPLTWLYDSSGSVKKDMHAVDYCLSIVEPLGATLSSPHMEVFVSEADSSEARRLLANHGINDGDLLVAMHPGGKYFPAKRWSTEGFAQVADKIASLYGAKVVTVGGKEDEELGKKIDDETKVADIVNLVGVIPIKQTIAVLNRANLFIGNDSSPMHMSVAVGTPVIALFGPTNPFNAQPYGEGHTTIFKNVVCSPCFYHNGNPIQYCPKCLKRECMEAITVDDVLEACRLQLNRTGWGKAICEKD